MNKEFLEIITLFIFASPFIALVVIVGYKVYRKFRPARKETHLEKQPERSLERQYMPYKPESTPKVIFNFVTIMILTVLAGLILGITFAVIGSFFYIVFIFPLVMGFAGSRILADAIHRAKIRRTDQVILLSLLMAITIYGTYHYGRYVVFQVRTSLEMFPSLSAATEDKNLKVTKAIVDYALEQDTGHSGFIGYMLFRAKEGVTIGRFYRSSRLNLGPILTWFYWMLEFGIVLWIPISTGKKLIGMPFCETCGNWYGKEKHLGGTNRANETILLDLIKQKDFIQLGKLIEKNAELPSVEMYLQSCEICNKSNSHLVVRRAFRGSKGGLQFSDELQTVLQTRDSTQLLNQLRFIEN